jgi:hypothetical protein
MLNRRMLNVEMNTVINTEYRTAEFRNKYSSDYVVWVFTFTFDILYIAFPTSKFLFLISLSARERLHNIDLTVFPERVGKGVAVFDHDAIDKDVHMLTQAALIV